MSLIKDIQRPRDFNLMLGADPEFFLRNKETGKIVSAHNIAEGSKEEPFPLTFGAMQRDGMAVEFNINPACTAAQFTNNIKQTIDDIRKHIPENYEFVFAPSVHFDKDHFESVPEFYRELGCNPDFDAYKDGAPNPRPQDVGYMRTGAGHIHFGWYDNVDPTDPEHIEDCCFLTKNLDDAFSLVEKWWDKDEDRRKMYGKPGAFRPKSYGMEYRSLSNAWVGKPELWNFIDAYCRSVFWLSASHRSFKTEWQNATRSWVNRDRYDYTGCSLPPFVPTKSIFEFNCIAQNMTYTAKADGSGHYFRAVYPG